MPTKLETLAEVPIFRGLSPDLLKEIHDHCVERTVARGETVFVQGEEPFGLIVVRRGALKVYKLGDTGREQIIEVEGPGRSVAELPLLDGQPYPASCAALEASDLLVLPAETFQRLLGREPALARAVIVSLAQRLRHKVALIEELSLKAVRQRLARLLVETAGEADVFPLPGTNAEIAARIGTVREIVSRTLSGMIQEGVLRVEGRTATIIDRDRL